MRKKQPGEELQKAHFRERERKRNPEVVMSWTCSRSGQKGKKNEAGEE